jgi:hypothetical protein
LSRVLCYTDPVVKNITITMEQDLAHWARRKAAEGNTSVSKFISGLLEREMRASDQYWRAYEAWKGRDLGVSVDASQRLIRGDVHARR